VSRDILDLPAPGADARLAYGPEPQQFGELRLPAGAGPHPVLVVIHGGFWRARYSLEHIGHLCAALTAAGLATWNVEYRRVGDAGGGWPGTFHDVAAAAEYVRELAPTYGLDLGRVVALGHSAGGHLALWLAGRHRIPPGDPLAAAAPLPLRAAVSLGGVVDLRWASERRLGNGAVEDLLGGPPDQVPERYAAASPAALLPLGVRQVLIHGTADTNVPFALSEGYVAGAVARGDDARLVPLSGAGHFEVIDPRSREWPVVAEAVGTVLR
jgi:acetyl esterase/lipase